MGFLDFLGLGKRRKPSDGSAEQLDISKMALKDPRIFEVAQKTAAVLSVGLMTCRDVDRFDKILASDRVRGYLVGFLDGASQFANLPFSSDEQFFAYVVHGHQYMAAGELRFFGGDTRKAAGFALDSLGKKGSAQFEEGQGIGGAEYFAWMEGGKSPNGLARIFHNL